jgi:hypothetical protein
MFLNDYLEAAVHAIGWTDSDSIQLTPVTCQMGPILMGSLCCCGL